MLGWPLVGGCASLIFFNGAVDPFGLHRWIDVPGFNAEKVAVPDHRRLTKAYLIRQTRPRGLILGTSQADAALDPGHPGWPDSARPVFNAGLPYANAYEMLRYFQHAIACGEVQEAVVGLDLVSFNAFLGNQEDFSETRLAVNSEGQWQRPPVDEMLALLLSLDGTRLSVETVRRQGEAAPSNADCHARFLVTEAEYAHFMWRHGPQHTYSLGDGTPAHSYFDEYRQLLMIAREHHVKLRVFFSPIHARLLETFRALGWWSVLEDWKRTLCAITDEVNALSPDAPSCELWDFADYTAVTTESLPKAGEDDTVMKGYADPAHYSLETGNLVLDRLFNTRRPGILMPHAFGFLLNGANLEAHLAAVRESGEVYRSSHADDIDEVRDIVSMKRGDTMSQTLDRIREATGR